MATGRVRQNRTNQMAPYFVQLREFERRLLKGAIEVADSSTLLAARMLGVTRHYLVSRAKLLGGVLGDEPKHEPPDLAIKAFNASHGRIRSKKPIQETEPEPEALEAPEATG